MVERSMATRGLALTLAAAMTALAAPVRVWGAGFALYESSPRLMSTAYSGTAVVEDATAGFYNAAGLSGVEKVSLVGAGTYAMIDLELDIAKATTFGRPVRGGSDFAKPARDKFIPAFHAAYRLNEDWVLGLGVTAPFGLETKYSDGSKARFVATQSDIFSFNINPNVAYRVTDQFKIGVGFNAQFLEAKLGENMAIPTLQGGPEGMLYIKMRDWGWGANAGVLYTPTARTKIGVNYRSQISYHLSGPATVSNVPPLISRPRGEAEGDLTVPDSVTLSFSHTVADKWQLVADGAWTHWNVVSALTATFDNGLPDNTVDLAFNDTWRGSAGLNYFFNDELTFRVGAGFDQSPVTDSNRTLRVPDANRVLVCFGLGYAVRGDVFGLGWVDLDGGAVIFDFGYMHIFVPETNVDETNSTPDKSNVQGKFTGGKADFVGLQISYNFDRLPAFGAAN